MKLKTYMDFKYGVVDNDVVIYKYTGNREEVSIPDNIDGMPVTVINASLVGDAGLSSSGTLKSVVVPEGVREIAIMSFGYSKSLENVTIPASVTKMDSSVFVRSMSLKSINVDDSNPEFSSVDGVLFNKDKTELIYFPRGKSYTTSGDIPEGRTEILEYTIPDGVASIGYNTFSDCFLKGVTIPDSVTDIGSRAFSGCCYLKNINLPEGITVISYDTFKDCISLTSIIIPKSVMKIDHSAFEGCTALTDIAIPDSVTEIRFSAFTNCISLASVNIPNGIKSIESNTFANCVSLECISIPATVTEIDLSAFAGCKSLGCINVDESNPVYASVDGSLFQKYGNKLIYRPHALFLKHLNK